MSRISLLWAREIGVCRPSIVKAAEESQRVYDFQLSMSCEIENVHSNGVNSLHLDPQECRYLLSGSSDKLITIYDTWSQLGKRSRKIKKIAVVGRPNHSRFAHKYSISCVQWYQHDNAIFTTSSADHTVKIWDSNSLRPAETFRFKSPINMHAMSTVTKSHNMIAVATADNILYMADMRTGSNSQILRGHRKAVISVKWSPRNEYELVSGSEDNRILLWDVRQARGHLLSFDQHNGKETKSRKVTTAHNGHVNGLCFTGDGLFLISTGTDNRIRLWNPSTGRNTLTNYGRVENSFRVPIQIAFNSDSSIAFVPNNRFLLMLNVHEGDTVKRLTGHFDSPICCEFNSICQELYSGGKDKNILVWAAPDPAEDDALLVTRNEGTEGTRSSQYINPLLTDTWSDEDSD